MTNLFLKNHKTKSYLKMMFLGEETDSLIHKNVSILNSSGHELQIEDLLPDEMIKDMDRLGWKIDQGMYDRLILEYNNNKPTKEQLTRWK